MVKIGFTFFLLLCSVVFAQVQAQDDIYIKPDNPVAPAPSSSANGLSVAGLHDFNIYAGLRCGVNNTSLSVVTNPNISLGLDHTISKTTLNATAFVYADLASSLSFQLECGLAHKRSGYQTRNRGRDTIVETIFDLYYLHVPLMARYRLLAERGSDTQLYMLLGIDLNFLIDANKQVTVPTQYPNVVFVYPSKDRVHATETSFVAGIGFTKQINRDIRFFVESRLALGLTDFNNGVEKIKLPYPYNQLELNNNYWQLTTGLSFRLY